MGDIGSMIGMDSAPGDNAMGGNPDNMGSAPDANDVSREPGNTAFQNVSTQSVSSETDEEITSMKGIKSSGAMLISEGTFTIYSADDSVIPTPPSP